MRGKSIFVLLLISFVILGSSLTNAGFFDFFKKDPSLAPSPIGVDLTINANVAPNITRFLNVPAAPFMQPYTAIAGANSGLGYIVFVAEDANGISDLPNNPLPAGLITGGVQTPVSSVVSTSVNVSVNSCSTFPCSSFPGACPNPLNSRIYACDFTLFYQLPPSTFSAANPNANDLYKIYANIPDIYGLVSQTAISGRPGFTNLPNDYVQINALSAPYIPTGTNITWSNISASATNQPASQPIVAYNLGNVAFTTTQITGTNLIGKNNPSVTLAVSAFSASGNTGGSPPAECNRPTTASGLVHATPVSIPNGGLPYTAYGSAVDNKPIYYCITQSISTPGIMTGGVDTSFSSTWQVNII